MEQGAKKDKTIIDLFEVLASALNPAMVRGSNKILSELSYTSYAHNRDLGMTHEQLVRIGLGDDDMQARYLKESMKDFYEDSILAIAGGGKIHELASVKCIITENDLMVYPKVGASVEVDPKGIQIGDLDKRFWSNLSTADRDLVYSLTHPDEWK